MASLRGEEKEKRDVGESRAHQGPRREKDRRKGGLVTSCDGREGKKNREPALPTERKKKERRKEKFGAGLLHPIFAAEGQKGT